MKRALSLLLACVLALALLSACGGKDAAEQTPAPETPPTQTAAAGGVDTSCKVYFPNDAADDLHADTAQIPDTEPAVTTAYSETSTFSKPIALSSSARRFARSNSLGLLGTTPAFGSLCVGTAT